MNRVYKVIWSKAKHCYVVTSEIARSVTKSASSARSAGRKGAAVLAMAALLFTAGGVLGEAAYVTDIEYGKTADVIMVTKDDGTTTPITITDVDRAIKANSDGDGLIIKENYVKNADARVSTDGEYVKKDKKVGENLSALDAQVKKNTMAVVEVGKKAGETFTDLYAKVQTNAQAVAAEETARKEVDKGSLKVNPDGVISKISNDDGSQPDSVKTLVLNKDGQNQITLSDKGIKVGLNSGVMDKDGFYAGGDTADKAMAALKADGKIKGANGAFTVDENGNVASKATITGETVTDGKGASMSNGTVTGGTVTSTGNISALGDIHAGGAITGASASIRGALTAGSATITGDLNAGGAIQGKSISDGTATMKNGDITGVKNLSAETITTHGDLTVNGKLNMDEIYMTKDGIVGDNNVKSSSTKVAAGEITSYKDAISTKDGSEKESAIDYDEKGTSTWAKATDADGKWNKSSLTVEGKGIKSIATDGTNNASTNLSNNGFNTFASDGTNKTYTKQTATDIKNTAEKGMISHTAKNLVNRAYENMTNTVDNDLTTTVGGEMKTTVTGKVTEDYQDALETTVGKDETHYVKGNQTNTVDGTLEETVKGKVTEDYQDALETTVGKDETHYVKGNQTNTVDGTLEETVKGKVTEDYQDALDTTVAKDETHYVKGSQSNTVDGTLNETVKGKVTEDYQDALDTTVAKDETHYVKGSQSNTVDGTLNETVTGDVTEDYKANLDTNVTGDSSLKAKNIHNTANEALTNDANTITNKAHESVTTQIGNGTTVKSVMDVNGIANTASTGTITNYAVTITNTGIASVTNQVSDNKVLVETNQVKSAFGNTIYTTWDADGITNNAADKAVKTITGNNTVISDNDGTTFENTAHSTAFKGGTVTKTTISGNTITTGKAVMDYANVTKDLSVGGNLNVAGNIETHDAVLSADSRQVVTGRQLYQTNERVDRLDNRIKKVGANAAALAALRPGDFNPDDKFSIAAGFGSYRNANAAALGLFYRPNENVLLSLGTSFGDGENMVNAGVSVKFGRGKSMAERRKEMADEVSSMRDEMRSQDERIAELEEMLKKQSELIEKLSKES